MEWKKVSDEFPPLGTDIFIGRTDYDYDFSWEFTHVWRPFDQSSKYNPDYYCCNFRNEEVMLRARDYWMKVEEPEEIQQKRKEKEAQDKAKKLSFN